ncbi:MAG: glycosyltransferase family 4 protein [Chloroflexota bacterium]
MTSWYTGLGGGETDLLALADHIDRTQYTLHLLAPREGQLTQKWRERDLPVHIVDYRGTTTWFIPAIWTQFPASKRIADIVRQHDIDLIHAQYHTLPFAYGASQQTSVPVIWSIWGWWFKPKMWQRSFLQQIPAVARSHSIREGYLGTPPFMPAEQIPVIYSGVDTDRFHPEIDTAPLVADLPFTPHAPIVALIARFQKVKGHHTFQALIRILAEQHPDVHFIVAGEDTFGVAKDEAYKQDILNTAQTDPLLKDRLHYIGFRDDIERVMTLADVVVCASEFESYGKVNLEAMACGTPVVSTNRGGPAETVQDGETGFLVNPDDPASLADRVHRLLTEPDTYTRISRAGVQHVREQFSASATARAYEAFFAENLP